MKKLSLVTAKVVRENEQYSYKLVGKGEKYLVIHEDGENAGEKVMKELAPYAKEPIVIESVVLKKQHEVVQIYDGGCVYQVVVECAEENEKTGKVRKFKIYYYVKANTTRDAFESIAEHLVGFVSDIAIVGVQCTKIIDIIY